MVILGTNLTWILMRFDVDLWWIPYLLIYHKILLLMGSLRSLDGFGLFLVQFQALISYVRIFGNFEYKSYVDFDEIWCGSLIDTILSSNWNWWFSTWGPRTGRDELSYGWLIEFYVMSRNISASWLNLICEHQNAQVSEKITNSKSEMLQYC